ncbi:MAG: pentapeptide repeat-containing protein [Acaryochloridaceae cyanobacterium RU_4_10]|nr:pentapeptide repeat-containing protein [Acaryochloridaceae cyanobacterium RU_4_10]
MNDHSEKDIICSVTQLIDQYHAGVRDFTGTSLSQGDLQGINLRGADLSYADLSEANLHSAHLRGVDLSYADLERANLQNADLRGAILIGTNLRLADLSQAHLHDADYDRTTHFPQGFDPVLAGLKLKAE